MNCSPSGSSVHGDSPGKNTGVGCHFLLQGIFPLMDQIWVSCIAGRFFTVWATREAHNFLFLNIFFFFFWESTKNSYFQDRIRGVRLNSSYTSGSYGGIFFLNYLFQCPIPGVRFNCSQGVLGTVFFNVPLVIPVSTLGWKLLGQLWIRSAAYFEGLRTKWKWETPHP